MAIATQVLADARPAPLTQTLLTKSYTVTITRNGSEHQVIDNDVTYRGVSRVSGQTITLHGSTWHTYEPDGTPSRFLGYHFQSGELSYEVLEAGRLIVTRGANREVLIDETGQWQRDDAAH